jgi:hypothetical protein
MEHFTAHCLRFVCEVRSPLELAEHPGSALRGALFGAMRSVFCANQAAASCAGCSLHARCPICFLLATVAEEAGRSLEVTRPYVIDPPPAGSRLCYEAGDTLTFGITLFARALHLFPFLTVAINRLEKDGLGRRRERPDDRWQGGRFVVRQVVAHNPLTGEHHPVVAGGGLDLSVPDIPVTHRDVLAAAERLTLSGNNARLTLDFLTPTRLAVAGRTIPRPDFGVLIQRLLERLDALDRRFAGGGLDPAESFRLVGLAGAASLAGESTRWAHAESYSNRQQRSNTISGFMGQAVYSGDLAPFLPYLIWGSITHVGKDAVKGDGLYRIACVGSHA